MAKAPVEPPKPPLSERRYRARLRALVADQRWRHRVILVLALLALLVVAGLALLARLYTVLPLDLWLTTELQEHQWALVARLMAAVSWVGYEPWSALAVGVGTALVALLLGWRHGLYLLLVTAAQGLLNALIKRAIGRPRPLDTVVEVFVPERGFSFPSGHVMFYTVFFGFLLFLVIVWAPSRLARWLGGTPLAALVLLVGPSRIILGAHWLSDVLAAYLLSLVLLALAIEGYMKALGPHKGTPGRSPG